MAIKRECATCDKLYLSKCYLNPPQVYYGASAEVEAYPSPTIACDNYSHNETKASAYAFSTESTDTTIVTGDILKMLVTFNTPIVLESADANSGFYIACTIGGVERQMKAAVVSGNTSQLLFSYTIVAEDGGTVLITSDAIEKFGSNATLQWVDDTINTNDGLKDVRLDGFIWSNIIYPNGTTAGTTGVTVDKAPSILAVTPVADGTYTVDDVITLTVQYDEDITITPGTGSAVVTYQVNEVSYDLDYDATLTAAAADDEIVFSRTVVLADEDGAITLDDDITLGGDFTIQDASAQDAQLTYAFSGIDTSGIIQDG